MLLVTRGRMFIIMLLVTRGRMFMRKYIFTAHPGLRAYGGSNQVMMRWIGTRAVSYKNIISKQIFMFT